MYVRTLDDAIEVLGAQKANLTQYQGELGATPEDLAAIPLEYDNAVALKTFIEGVITDKSTAVQMKDSYLSGVVNSPVSAAPVFQVFVWPNPAEVVGGQFSRINTRNRRYRNSPTYTEEAGLACKVSTDPAPPPDPQLIKPSGEAHASLSGFSGSVVITGRTGSDRWVLYGRTASNEPWQMIDSFTDKAGNFARPGITDAPYVLELYIQLMKKDQPFGQPSDTFYLTLNP